ncbi:hypothetical protein LCGC14_1491780 [marine sediment metagenome]|uniref:Uncharacterized protein n=1 Tax=marine sediment metagenome TaxID=412755 RepID=A0A0F9J787_9ZZZZ
MKTPFDDDIAAIEARRSDVHLRYALTVLRRKRQGWLDAHEKLLPLLRGVLGLTDKYGHILEDLATDEDMTLIESVGKVVKE